MHGSREWALLLPHLPSTSFIFLHLSSSPKYFSYFLLPILLISQFPDNFCQAIAVSIHLDIIDLSRVPRCDEVDIVLVNRESIPVYATTISSLVSKLPPTTWLE